MSDSVVIDWLNENELRAFPLKEGISRVANSGYKLLDDVIVDAQFTFEVLNDSVALTSITADSEFVSFVINDLTFVAQIAESFPQYLRHETGCLLVIGPGVLNIPARQHNFTNVIFEPSVSYEFGGEWLGVKNISFETAEKLTGDITLLEGYQTDLNINSNIIFIELGKYLGNHIKCNSFSNVNNDCSSIVSFINGATPNNNSEIFLKGDGNIVIVDDPEYHRIFVGTIYANAKDICQDIPANPAL